MSNTQVEQIEAALLKCLCGTPNEDVAAACLALGRIAKSINPKLTGECFVDAFGEFWSRCCAYPDRSPVSGTEFMRQVMPDIASVRFVEE